MKYKFDITVHKTLCDTHTPVELYLKLRDHFPNSFLLESSDYKSRENSYSYLCLAPIASFVVGQAFTRIRFPDGKLDVTATASLDVTEALNNFAGSFETDDLQFGFGGVGLFGYTAYDAVNLFENIRPHNQQDDLPLMQYHLFRFLIVFNHFNNELYLLELLQPGEHPEMSHLQDLIDRMAVPAYPFSMTDAEESNVTDEEFLSMITTGQAHVFRGDVFQVVLSRKFTRRFRGDEFNVYRALRSINPSPYLFYFDYGDFKLFGSSPEAQLMLSRGEASIRPIAGTFRRTGNRTEDEALAESLTQDPKENAEHVMLVDLARNDLSRHSTDVVVDRFREVEYYSHVIHLVSGVRAKLDHGYNPVRILADTFPAGTLTGAPKHRAMEIISKLEKDGRGFYGGAIGILGLHGSVNHAIYIRSFVSRQNQLHYQAGCGIVALSVPEQELTEVDNKLSALRKALSLAETINTRL